VWSLLNSWKQSDRGSIKHRKFTWKLQTWFDWVYLWGIKKKCNIPHAYLHGLERYFILNTSKCWNDPEGPEKKTRDPMRSPEYKMQLIYKVKLPGLKFNFNPRAIIWTILVELHYTMPHAKNLTSNLCQSRGKDFKVFNIKIIIGKTYDPQGWANFDQRDIIWANFGRGKLVFVFKFFIS
jgi:hypothetical protein